MNIIEVSSLEELQQNIADEVALLVYFYNDNCAPCLSLRPKVKELVDMQFPKMKMIMVNSINRELPAHFGIYDNPTILVFFDRKEYIRESKYVAMPKLEAAIDRYYQMIF